MLVPELGLGNLFQLGFGSWERDVAGVGVHLKIILDQRIARSGTQRRRHNGRTFRRSLGIVKVRLVMIIGSLGFGVTERVEALGNLDGEPFRSGAGVLVGARSDFGDLARHFPGTNQIPRRTGEHDCQNGQSQRQRSAMIPYRPHS